MVAPIKTVKLSADYFAIKIDKYVSVATALGLINQANGVNNQYVTFNPDGSANTVDERSINAGLAKFAGFDLGASWSDKFSFGKLTVDYNGTRMTKASLKTPDGTEDAIGKQVDSAGAVLKLVSIGGTIMKYKHKINFDWTYGAFGATLTQNYTDRYEDGPDLNGARHFVPGYSIYDLQARYSYSKDLNFSVGAKNLFDKDPPLYINTVNFFAYGFDPAQYDPLGRFVYVKATYKF
jgi:iron complex outermembrane receptor protein